jgi:cytochrome c2
MVLRFIVILFVVTLTGCDEKPEPSEPAPDERVEPKPEPARPPAFTRPDLPRAAEGARLIQKLECHRCHAIEGVEQPSISMDCTGCHRAIITREYPEPEEYLAMWDDGLENMRDVPSLVDAHRRFQRQWFVDFLVQPHDLRPRLGATMPRMTISTEQAEAIADFLGLTDSSRDLPDGDPEAGRKLVDKRGCGSCHVMSGVAPLEASKIPVEMDADTLARAMLLAPDLRVTRKRFRREVLVRWLRTPADVKRDALMPDLGLTRQEANDIAAFITGTPLEDTEPEPPPAATRPAPLDRQVGWKEVQAKVFDEICLHCHSDPKYNDGDGGPGNTGGFGFDGKGIDFSTYERAVYGTGGGDKPRAIYTRLYDGTPKVIAHMLARHDEVAGRESELLGMPLGFPPIPMERIRLLDTWIRQGMPE